MNIKNFVPLLGLFVSTAGFCADESIFKDATDLKRPLYTVDSAELDATDSLNRISGDIDLGFSADDDSYQSIHHYSPGPFGMQDQNDNADGAE